MSGHFKENLQDLSAVPRTFFNHEARSATRHFCKKSQTMDTSHSGFYKACQSPFGRKRVPVGAGSSLANL